MVRWVCAALLVWIVVTHPYLEWEWVYGRLNVPVADLAALLLGALYLAVALREGGSRPLVGRLPGFSSVESGAPRPWLSLPWAGLWGLFLLALVASVAVSPWPAESAYWIVRKPLFCSVAYGVGVAGVVAWLNSPGLLHGAVLAFAVLGSAAMSWAMLPLWSQGYGTFFAPVPGLTNNYKAIAVALGPVLPFLWVHAAALPARWARISRALCLVMGGVLLLSLSKTAFITVGALVAIQWEGWPLGTSLRQRPRVVAAVAGLLVLGMVLLPVVTGERGMSDAFNSRMSLNLRAWKMFEANPLLGQGAGSSTRVELSTAPHWRINGVEAHGVIQKVGAEAGLLGLAAWSAFAAMTLRSAWRLGVQSTSPHERAAGLLIVGLFLNLLLSTEMFTSGHWALLGVGVGMLSVVESGNRTFIRKSDNTSPRPIDSTC